MIQIKPSLNNSYTCPSCGTTETTVSDILPPGIFWLIQCVCLKCKSSFEETMNVGHTIDLTLVWDKSNQKLSIKNDPSVGVIGANRWLPGVFEKFVANRRAEEVSIRKLVFFEARKVIILNALDWIFGHSLLKLYNAQYHLAHNTDHGLVIIVPRALEWLLPKGIAEAWIVDLSFGDLKYSHTAIEKFMRNELERFDHVSVSYAYSHPDFSSINIEQFTGIRPFDLSTFNVGPPRFTFILRADRPWLRNSFTGTIHWIFMKLKMLKQVEWLYAGDQNRLVRKTISIIKSHLPSAEIFVTGFGKYGSFKNITADERYDNVNVEIEKKWCMIYAKSHLVIGVHGSNMLLPTAFAAGCLEILPGFRTYNIAQDLSVRYNDRRQLFLYRFVDQYVSPKSLANKAVVMIRDYNSFYRNMILNVYKPNS